MLPALVGYHEARGLRKAAHGDGRCHLGRLAVVFHLHGGRGVDAHLAATVQLQAAHLLRQGAGVVEHLRQHGGDKLNGVLRFQDDDVQ